MAEFGGYDFTEESKRIGAHEKKAVKSQGKPGSRCDEDAPASHAKLPICLTQPSCRRKARTGQPKPRLLERESVKEGGQADLLADEGGREVSHYKMESSPRGYALLLSNTKFQRSRDRNGGAVDLRNMRMLWWNLSFETYVLEEKTAQEMRDKIQKFSQLEGHWQMDCCVVVLMSHGAEEAIYGTDDNPVFLREIFAMFDDDKCPHLKEKPKLFLVDSCRGEKVMAAEMNEDASIVEFEDETSAAPLTRIWDKTDLVPMSLTGPDVFCAFAALQGYVAFRNIMDGSWFLQGIKKVFMEHASNRSLLDMMTMVTQCVSERRASCPSNTTYHGGKQQPEFSSSLSKLLYFFPGSVALSDPKRSDRHLRRVKNVDITKYFDKIVKEASCEWDNLARKLKFNDNEINEIENGKRDDSRRCREMLRRWRNRDGQTATLQALKKALKKIGERHLAERLEELSDSSSDSTDS